MKIIDTLDIPFPKNIDELAALNATREIPYLKALCNRRHIRTPGPNPTPGEIIPIIQEILNRHLTLKPKGASDIADIMVEWRLIRDDLTEFLENLHSLLPRETPHAHFGTQCGTNAGTLSGTHGGMHADPNNATIAAAPNSSPTQITNPPLHPTFPPEPPIVDLFKDIIIRCGYAKPKNNSNLNPGEPAGAQPQTLSDLCQEISDRLNDNKNKSPLDDLPAEKQATLFQLLKDGSYSAVEQVIALPAPQGWGMKIARGSLQRFYNRYEKRQRREQLRETARLAREILSDPDATDATLLAASTHLANLRLLELAHDPKARIRDLKDLFQIQIRLKSLDISQQRLDLQKQKQNQNHGSPALRDDEALTNPAPETIANPAPPPNPEKVGPAVLSGPRPYEDLPSKNAASSARQPSDNASSCGSRGDEALTNSAREPAASQPDISCRNRREEILTHSAPYTFGEQSASAKSQNDDRSSTNLSPSDKCVPSLSPVPSVPSAPPQPALQIESIVFPGPIAKLASAMKTILTAAILLPFVSTFAADQATFRAQEIDNKIQIGYGLAIADVNGDKKLDILLADAKQIVWYEAPNWTKHVIAENLTEKDNVCIAAQDIDGDGKAEVAVGAGWNPGDTVNSGALFYLIPPADRTQKWESVALHHEPTIHRIKWVKGADGKYGLVSIPLHGRGNKNGEGAGVKHEFYHVPADVKSEWPRTLIDEDMHMTHNFEVLPGSRSSGIIVAGKEGISLYQPNGSAWTKQEMVGAGQEGFNGAGEVRRGIYKGRNFLAAIEPMHGSNVVIYTREGDDSRFKRTVLDSSLIEGHAVQCADFLGDRPGPDQIAVGWRGKLGAPAGSSSTGVKLFIPNKDGTQWTQQMIDDKGMACEDLAVADLNGDGKPDLIAAGRATKNVKIYWNETK